MNYYIVTFDRQPDVAYGPFHTAFVEHPSIKKWWHYIKSSYLIGADLSASELSDHFTNTAKKLNIKTNHLVVAVDLTKRQGMLPKDAWQWFKKNA
ncbi:MAG: hypothetical protein AABY68_11070 [Pseudomonadota bacterium]